MAKSTTPRKAATERRVTVAALAHSARRSVSVHRVEPGVRSGSTHDPAGQIVVTGVAENDVRQALELLDAARELQRDVTNLHADALLTAMTTASIPALPEPNAVLAQRRSVLRRHLLASGVLSNKDIAERRGITESSARTFVARERDKHRLFTVKHDGRALVPGFLLDADGQRTAIAAAVEVLVPLGLDGWELWSWLASPSGWLSGEVPADVFATDIDRAMAAVHAYASELATTIDT